MTGMKYGRSLCTAAALTLVTMSFAAVRAQQPPAQPAGQPAAPPQGAPAQPAAPQKPLVPLSVGTLLAHPERYMDQTVTVTGPVEEPALSPLSFTLDADSTKSGLPELLVLAPRLNEPVQKNSYITVIAKVVPFNQAELAKTATDRKIDLPADAAAKFAGKPALLASFVMTSSYYELSRKNPPPLSPDDMVLQPIMKKLQPAVGTIRQAADKSDMATVSQNAMLLKQSFTEVETFFKKANNPAAMKLASDARVEAEALQKIVATGKWDEVKTQAGAVQQKCAACHGQFRERFDDGSYRLKVASK